MLLKNIAHVGSFKHFVFVYLRMVNGRGEDKRRRNQGGAPDSPIDHDEDQDGGFGGHLTSVWVEATKDLHLLRNNFLEFLNFHLVN